MAMLNNQSVGKYVNHHYFSGICFFYSLGIDCNILVVL